MVKNMKATGPVDAIALICATFSIASIPRVLTQQKADLSLEWSLNGRENSLDLLDQGTPNLCFGIPAWH